MSTDHNSITLTPIEQDVSLDNVVTPEHLERPIVTEVHYRGVNYSFDTELMDIFSQEGISFENEIRSVIDNEIDAGNSVNDAANAVGIKANEMLEVLVKKVDASYVETVKNTDGSTSETFHGNQTVENDVDNHNQWN